MSETAERKVSRFSRMKSEFRKIVWPDKKSVGKQTVAVVIISVILGLLIAALDVIFKYGIDFLIGL